MQAERLQLVIRKASILMSLSQCCAAVRLVSTTPMGLGSVTSLSNSAGTLASTYGYDSCGKQTSSSGSLTMDVIHAGSKSFSFFNTSISREPRELFCGTLFCHIDKVIASRMQTTTFLKKVSRR